MSSYATERLSDALSVLASHNANQAIDGVFKMVWEGNSSANNQLGIIYLFADARAEVCLARLSERVRNRAIRKLDVLASGFQQALNNTNWEGFKAKFSARNAVEDIDDITDLLETASFPRSAPIDREAIFAGTAELMVEIDQMDIPEAIRTAAKIQLGSVTGLLSISATASDELIARTIKSVVADLLVGLEPYLDDEPDVKNKIIDWGKKSTMATAFALGFLVDGASAVQMLTPPEAASLLEAPAKQITDQRGEDGE